MHNPSQYLFLAAYRTPDPKDAPKIIPALLQALKDPLPEKRALAAIGLSHFGSAAADVSDDLRRLLTDKYLLPRLYAAYASWELEKRTDVVLPYVEEATRCEEKAVAELAAIFLMRLGPVQMRPVSLRKIIRDHVHSPYKTCSPICPESQFDQAAQGTLLGALHLALNDPNTAKVEFESDNSSLLGDVKETLHSLIGILPTRARQTGKVQR